MCKHYIHLPNTTKQLQYRYNIYQNVTFAKDNTAVNCKIQARECENYHEPIPTITMCHSIINMKNQKSSTLNSLQYRRASSPVR